MAETHNRKAARRIMNSAGYGSRGGHLGRADGGTADDAEDKAFVRRGVSEHESALHKGEPKTRLRFQDGGSTMDDTAPPRHDRHSRGSKGKSDHPRVNILIHSSPHPDVGSSMGQPGGMPPAAPPPPPPPHPAMGMPPGMPPMPGAMGMPPPNTGMPGGSPMMRPPGMARGGRAAACADGGDTGPGTHKMKYGSGSGAGRLAKANRQIPRYPSSS